MATNQVAHREAADGVTTGTAADRGGSTLTAWVRRYPIGAFVAWYLPLCWAISFTPIVATNVLGLDLPAWVTQVSYNAASLLAMFLPAVVITRLVDGPAGVRALLGRVVKVRASLGWYAVALLAHPVLTVLVAVLLYGRPEATASTLLAALASGFLFQIVAGFFLNNLWEEVGVMGFLQARLQARHGALLGAAITAPLFALQHAAAFMGNGLVTGLIILLVTIALMFPFRVMMGWMYNRTGSLFLVGLLHAAGNAVAAGSGFGEGLLRLLYENQSLVGAFHVFAESLLGVAVVAITWVWLGVRARAARRAQAGITPAA
jgi:CAAX protease family protein